MNGRKRPQAEGHSIRITLKVFGGLRQLRPSTPEDLTVPANCTIDDLWSKLALGAPIFVEKLRDGIAGGYLHVLLNGRNIVFLEGAQTKLTDGDTVAVLPPVGGG